jgi:hypothetical protein
MRWAVASAMASSVRPPARAPSFHGRLVFLPEASTGSVNPGHVQGPLYPCENGMEIGRSWRPGALRAHHEARSPPLVPATSTPWGVDQLVHNAQQE